MFEEEEPALDEPALLDEPVPDPNYLHFFNELRAMIDRGTPDGAPPGITLLWEEYRDFTSAPTPTTPTVSTELALLSSK